MAVINIEPSMSIAILILLISYEQVPIKHTINLAVSSVLRNQQEGSILQDITTPTNICSQKSSRPSKKCVSLVILFKVSSSMVLCQVVVQAYFLTFHKKYQEKDTPLKFPNWPSRSFHQLITIQGYVKLTTTVQLWRIASSNISTLWFLSITKNGITTPRPNLISNNLALKKSIK